MQSYSGTDFVLHALLLRSLDDLSLWATLLVWAVRILTVSLLLRTYIGPAVVSLVSTRLRVRSISLRSIRGVYFKAGHGTWRVERIGISYHRPSSGYATRFSFQVQGLSLELDSVSTIRSSIRHKVRKPRPTPSRLARRLWMIVCALLSSLYNYVEPHVRPTIRTFVVTTLRLAISALPTLTNGLDFELEHATVSHSSIAGVRWSVGHAKLHSAVSLAYLPSVVSVNSTKVPTGHRRFASVADWNARLKGSFRRTWDRAWGATQVSASITLQVNAISGHADKSSELFAGSHRGHYFLDVPSVQWSLSGRLNPQQGVQPRSVEMSLDLGKINIQLDVVQKLLKTMKQRREAQEGGGGDVIRGTGMNEASSAPLSATSQPSTGNRAAWRSPLSPSSPLMEALSASMRWRRAAKQSRDLKTRSRAGGKPMMYIVYIKSVEVNIPQLTASMQPQAANGAGGAVLYGTIQQINLRAGLSHPESNDMHKEWLGIKTVTSAEPTADAYSVVLEAKKLTLDRNGIGELMEHLRMTTLDSFKWHSLLVQWPSPWVTAGPALLAGDPNAHLLVSNLSLATVEVTERLDILEGLIGKERSIEKTVHGQSLLPPMLSPMPRVSFGVHVGEVSLRLISPTSESDQDPFVLEARTDGIAASLQSHFTARPDHRYGNVERDFTGLDMEFRYGLTLNPLYTKMWFGPDAHARGAHPQDFPAPSYPSETLLQVDAVHAGGTGHGLGEFADEAAGIVSVDTATIYTHCQIATDAVSVELWQPDVIKSLARILSRLNGNPKPKTPKPSRRVLDELPFGVDVSIAIGRFSVFLTSPDLAPDDTLNISRGIASRMGISITYNALQKHHCSRLSAVFSRDQQRSELSLPKELILHVVREHSTPAAFDTARALIQVSLWDIVLRDAFATPFAADDPYGLGDQSVHHRSLEFLHVDNCDIHAVISGQRPNGVPLPKSMDDCHVEITIPKVRVKMNLSQVYNALLAAHTVQTLLPSPPRSAAAAPGASSTLRLHLQVRLQQLQLLWRFPLLGKMFLRLSALECDIGPDRNVTVRWDHILTAVNVTARHEGHEQEEWEELMRLPRWKVEVNPGVKPVLIRVKGDSGRLRIPFDFVLADLILDLNLTIKSVKHLVRLVRSGRYEDPPPPPAEDAKQLPDIRIELGRLVVEAADDEHEARMALIWRTGFNAAKVRREREEAFQAKVETITSPKPSSVSTLRSDSDFQFSSKHTVSITDARNRLDQVHTTAWRAAMDQAFSKQTEREEAHWQNPIGSLRIPTALKHDMVTVNSVLPVPPLVRLAFNQLSLAITPPSFPYSAIPDYLHEVGNGLPRDTQYSLLVPMHIHFTVTSLRLAFRSYPLPLLHIPPHSKGHTPALDFDTELVIAEEIGTENSVEWVPCEIVKAHSGMHGAAPISLRIPKTLMPVKTYARPTIRVLTDGTTDFSWGVSYQPATQDLMRVLDTLSHAPRDSSPAIGFWDKLRLILHWRVKVLFRGEVHLHMKGSRDPFQLDGHGAGFAFCWKGSPQLLIGQPNGASELIQVISDSMSIIIPNTKDTYGDGTKKPSTKDDTARPAPIICAKFRSGTCFGVRFVLERTCGPECGNCSGKPFDRQCRMYHFKPHYDVKLEWKDQIPVIKSQNDSYNGFRSDFIHMSISLTSGLRKTAHIQPNNLHLSPTVFEHFWSWWHLFNGALSLPVRQGKLYPRKRPISPKFGQHLSTLKYLVSVPKVFISHVYVDDSQDAWADGVTPYVGVKALINEFHADLHQRDTERTEVTHGGTKTIHHKPFYAIEVVLKGLDLRAMLAVFSDPLKQCTPIEYSPLVSNYRTRNDLPSIPLHSSWVDMDDFAFVKTERTSVPDVHLLPAVSCPRFTYFKQEDSGAPDRKATSASRSKFGAEDTHVCFIGKEPSVSQVQMDLVSERIDRLHEKARQQPDGLHDHASAHSHDNDSHENGDARRAGSDLPRMISLLESYKTQLRNIDKAAQATAARNRNSSYYMPTDLVTPEEWAEFDNVYQMHNPHIIMDNAIRDIMMQYYYCSRSRRGFEYHMAQRAVKFIRDQAQASFAEFQRETDKHSGPSLSAHAAAAKIKTFLTGDSAGDTPVEFAPQTVSKLSPTVDPLYGWAEGVSVRKGHFCLLLKPQIVLRSNDDRESVCVLAAVQGKLKTFAIMDDANVNDPVSGKIMNRNFAWLTGLQTFSPSATNTSGKDYVPLEVLVDLRADNSDFDRLVPQTDATFQYDKFNRLRLRNDTTAVAKSVEHKHAHLQNQTDLIRVHVPRFTVSANDRHFQAISNIVTKLLLFTDAAHKTRAEKLENLLFSYDFTNFTSAADVVAGMQHRLRQALETKVDAEQKLRGLGNPGRVELLKIDAHILLLIEELNLIFDAIKLAQDKASSESDQKSALLLHASSEELSWRMLDQHDQLLAKVAIRVTDYYWLSRHDSSTVNNLAVGDLQAFDGAADAEWTEILSKYDEPSTHPLVKRKLFLLAHWTVLPPVGGITIYEDFELSLHPMRLQIDTRVGRKIMCYVWPSRRDRPQSPTETESFAVPDDDDVDEKRPKGLPAVTYTTSPRSASFDLYPTRKSLDMNRLAPPPALRRLGTSRSFTDLRKERQDSLQVPRIQRMNSSGNLRANSSVNLRTNSTDGWGMTKAASMGTTKSAHQSKDKLRSKETDDAMEMKTRASQKTFVRVKIASLHLLLSIAKEDSFLCRDARIRTRDLEYRNRTWSFEELVEQFIPSGRNWRGWVKVAFQQPLVPVLPVARELITKTKWIAKKDTHLTDRPSRPSTPKLLRAKRPTAAGDLDGPRKSGDKSTAILTDPSFLTSEPEALRDATMQPKREGGVRKRAMSLFRRKHRHGNDSTDTSEASGSITSVSSHIMLNSRQLPHRPSVSSIPEGFVAGPSRRVNGTSSTLHQRSHHSLRHPPDGYFAEGQQAELRVPNNGHGDLEGSQINLALRQIEGDDYDRSDSEDEHHHDDIVEHLDVIDPQVSTVSTLTNAANAIVVPPLSFYSRKPVIVLPRPKRKKKKQNDVEKGTATTEEENLHEDALDEHVHDVLNKRDKFRRIMAGVWSFLKTLFWGCGIVVFLIPLWDVHNDLQQGYWVELCQQVETGLFTVTSIGFIPFRVMDTYRICKIWYYQRKILQLRQKAGLLDLYDPDDLPDPVYDKNYVQVLSDKEQIDLHYRKHLARLALWICICNDLNSFFQCLLSGTMWGLDRFQRPAWTTGTTLPLSFLAGIAAGVLIYWGGRKTRRTQQVEDRLRLALDMETDAKSHREERSGSASLSATEEGVQQPPRALEGAQTSSKVASPAASETNLAPAAVDYAAGGGQTATIPEEAPQARERKPSSASLMFSEEMVVPLAEDIHNR
ncbi:golgi-body localization protein domain-containing protein [Dichomitus squalens]|uniref:Golgi-body localization protein domain-containing protein n=1 Tax=Dichomitus squalens TaxID=114155 RepID=A0A4Q9Q902_9APHY|nr:golgi-body localization protein domain-containing protein [Dichomitus squalens]TBU63955.1 golgi-body localization protein domain-containing protein [Dichomitus squalens]